MATKKQPTVDQLLLLASDMRAKANDSQSPDVQQMAAEIAQLAHNLARKLGYVKVVRE